MMLVAALGGLALFLAAIGIHALISSGVTERTRELGIRMALGARPRDVSRMVSRVGLRLAGAGIALGLACALSTSRLLRGLLYETVPTDPVTLGLTAVAVFLVALVATWIPARRAGSVDPIRALRAD
jgi:ABC-type antimicrobial peptide transport system permease subunit